MNPIETMKLHIKEFTKSDLIIFDFMINNLDVVTSYPILTVAEKIKVSKSALLRFCQKCGYQGYSEFKYDVSRFLISGANSSQDKAETLRSMLKLYSENILKLDEFITEPALTKLSNLIVNANKIRIHGMHETGLSANYLEFRLNTLGIDAHSISVPSVIVDKSAISKPNDLNIYLSISGTNPTIEDSIENSIYNGSKTVVVTHNDKIKNKENIDLLMLIPTLGIQDSLFIDSQAILFVVMEMIINHLAKILAKIQ